MSTTLTAAGQHVAGGAVNSRAARYGLVSVGAGLLAQAGLVLAYGVFGWGTTAASLFSLAVSVGPSYWGCRTHVWQYASESARSREMASFVAVAVLGTTTAAGLTALAQHLGQFLTDNRAYLSIFVSAGSVAATVVVWMARYFVLDRYVFRSRS